MSTVSLKKQVRMIDLALQAGRARQSNRTKFVHDDEVISIYENFCFTFVLFRHKTAESILEGKELLSRLLAFQQEDGNFPVFLHDYPRCFDFQLSLKVAPILIYLQRLFGSILGEQKGKIELALSKILSQSPPEKPVWQNRYRACVGEPLAPVDTTLFSPAYWVEWLITAQLASESHFPIPYDETMQLFMGPPQFDVQEEGEPKPNPIEWLLADGNYSARLLRTHPDQLLCAPLFPITHTPVPFDESTFRFYWKGEETLHSLVAKSLIFDLPDGLELGRHDLFEAALFCDISPETTIYVNGKRATVFHLGDEITIETPTLKIALSFELTQGIGDFCGSVFRSNRPSQMAKGYEAYDWQIGLRTLRRSGPAQIKVHLAYH
jgi:hypothetical protein